MGEQIIVSCLGRPMAVGMLYDCRKDELIPGVTLWDPETLEKNSNVLLQESSEFNISADDSMENKARLLNLDANIKLSFMGGLINAGGAAKYLNNNRSSTSQARVTLTYSCKSGMETLTMKHLGTDNIQHHSVFDDAMATHVVTAIEYGADAIFVFDGQESSFEKRRELEGKLEISLQKIPNVELADIGGDISLQMNGEDRESINSFKCTFHGDVILKGSPTTFNDTVKIYKKLPGLIKESNKKREIYGVPKKAYLYPLYKLNNKAAKLVRLISNNVVDDTQYILEGITRILATVNDLENSDISQKFLKTKQQIVKFKSLLNQFRSELQRILRELLPKIRSDEKEESELMKKIEEMKSSPYDIAKLDEWINMRNCELACLEKYIESLNGFPFASQPGELQRYTQNHKLDYVLCLSLGNITNSKTTFLDLMETYLSNEDKNMDDNMEACGESWSEDFEITSDIRNKIREFKDFAKPNKEQENLKFIFSNSVFKENESISGCSIILYSKTGRPKVFQPPGSPGQPQMEDTDEDEITISWAAPTVGVENVISYNILYRSIDVEDSSWSCVNIDNSKLTFTVKQLTPGTEYLFKIEAVSEAGKTQPGPQSSPIKTKSPLSATAYRADKELIKRYDFLISNT